MYTVSTNRTLFITAAWLSASNAAAADIKLRIGTTDTNSILIMVRDNLSGTNTSMSYNPPIVVNSGMVVQVNNGSASNVTGGFIGYEIVSTDLTGF